MPDTLFGVRFTYIGLLAFTNQTKDTIPYAVKSCYKAGVNVIMTTGDSEEAAAAIARKIGMCDGKIITGDRLREWELSGEAPDISGVNIFARVTPEQRREIVGLLQKRGEIVAMTGDELQDAEVLRKADVGIAVTGGSCPAVQEACDLLMSDENFIAVVDAVKESRQVHRNMKRCIQTVLSAQTAIVIFAIFGIFAGARPLLTPILPTLLTVFIIPVCSLFFLDNYSELKSGFVSSGFIGRGKINKMFFIIPLAGGALLSLGIILFYMISLPMPKDFPEVFRSIFLFMFSCGLAFTTLTRFSEIRGINEAGKNGKMLLPLLLAGIVALAVLVLIFVPFINTAFGFGQVSIPVLLVSLLITAVFGIWFEIIKYIKRNR